MVLEEKGRKEIVKEMLLGFRLGRYHEYIETILPFSTFLMEISFYQDT